MKETKNIFKFYVLESHFTSISGLGGFILSKRPTLLYMLYLQV
jgi:hypothetical protein